MLLAVGYEFYLNHLIIVNNLDADQIRVLLDHKLKLPIAELITFGTIVIPAIMIRKAVREGTHNAYVKTKYSEELYDEDQED